MFQFPEFASITYVFSYRWLYKYSRVPPFGHLWLNACFQLPIAFRRIPRPSSPLTAKASTVCASLLDHIISITSKLYAHTSKILSSLVLPHFFTKFLMNVWTDQIKILFKKALWSDVPEDEDIGGAEEDRTPDPLRARQVLSQLSYDPFFDCDLLFYSSL